MTREPPLFGQSPEWNATQAEPRLRWSSVVLEQMDMLWLSTQRDGSHEFLFDLLAPTTTVREEEAQENLAPAAQAPVSEKKKKKSIGESHAI